MFSGSVVTRYEAPRSRSQVKVEGFEGAAQLPWGQGVCFGLVNLFIWIPKSVAVGGTTTSRVALLVTQLVFAMVWFLFENGRI